MSLLYVSITAMVLCAWPVALGTGRMRTIAAVTLAAAALLANLLAGFVIDGYADGAYAAVVTAGAVAGWMVHFRLEDGRIECRIRLHTHLVFYYVLVWAEKLIALALGLVLADLLNQSLLQADPIMPGLAAFLGVPEWARGSVEQLTTEQRLELRWVYAKIFLTMHAANNVIRIAHSYYRIWILQRINQDLRLALLDRWHQLSLKYHADHRTGDSIFRIYQDSAQVTAVIDKLMLAIIAVISYFTAAVLVFALSPWIGAIAASSIVPFFLWARWAMPRMRTRSLTYRAAASDVTSRLQESFKAIRVIKAYGAEDRAQAQLEEDSIIAFNAGYRVRVVMALVTIVMFTITTVFLLSGEFLMAVWASRGSETFANELILLVGVSFVVWNLTAFNWAKAQFGEGAESLRGVMLYWLNVQDIAMGLRRVFNILDIEPDVKDREDAVALNGVQREIRFDSVSFAYEPTRPVLAGVSFTAEPGSVTAIVGPTGSGKTTLVGLLLRLYEPTAGSISIDGQELTRDTSPIVAAQHRHCAAGEHVVCALGARQHPLRRSRCHRCAGARSRSCGLHGGLRRRPAGRPGHRARRPRRQAVHRSAPAAVDRTGGRSDTPILILDEPTAALDAATEHR